jgi:hypothetical protein
MSWSRWSAIGAGALLWGGCAVEDARTYEAPDLPPALRPSELDSTSWDVCRVLGPAAQSEGIYGTDLGYTTPLPDSDKLAVLFGDTWSEAGDACQYPVTPADDLQATLPRERPEQLRAGKPSTDAKDQACAALEYTLDDPNDPQSWRRMRLFATVEDRDGNTPLETGALRTPVAAWTTHREDEGAALYAMFSRGDAARCDATRDCPDGMLCSNDEARGATRLGLCTQTFELSEDPMPNPCRDDDDCGPASSCNFDVRAMCLTDRPFSAEHDGERIEPSWYMDDARLGVAQTMYIARAAWAERPEDYLIEHHFVTRRFVNVVARTVAHFDPEDPAANDYRPGDHTLLMWGRPEFVGKKGAQSLPFLLYVPLAELEDEESPRWQPRFFAGYDDAGDARWSEIEQEAVPLYGTEADVVRNNEGADTITWREPELDYVNQMSVTFIEPLQRFVMLYGGDVPAWLVMDEDGNVPPPLHPGPSPGAIHHRSARHPWGRATQSDPKEDAWSSPEPVLTRNLAAPYLACGDDPDELPGCTESDEHGPFDLLATIAGLATDEPSDTLDITADCIEGSAALAAQTAASGDSVGRLYGVSVIEEWTADVTDDVRGLAEGERAAEVYWNVSTWNPYQVVLMKTQLRGKPLAKPEK